MRNKIVIGIVATLGFGVTLTGCGDGKVRTPQVTESDSTSNAIDSSNLIPSISINDVKVKEMKSHLVYRLIQNNYDSQDTTYNESTIKLQWPEEIKGYEVAGLQKALIKSFFNKDYSNIDEAWKSLNKIDVKGAVKLSKIPESVNPQRIIHYNSVIEINKIWNNVICYTEKSESNDGENGGDTRYFYYDLTSQSPVNFRTLFTSPSIPELMKLIEQQMCRNYGARTPQELKEKGYDLSKATGADQISFDNNYMTFYFDPYIIADGNLSWIEVQVPINSLQPYMSDLGKSIFFPDAR